MAPQELTQQQLRQLSPTQRTRIVESQRQKAEFERQTGLLERAKEVQSKLGAITDLTRYEQAYQSIPQELKRFFTDPVPVRQELETTRTTNISEVQAQIEQLKQEKLQLEAKESGASGTKQENLKLSISDVAGRIKGFQQGLGLLKAGSYLALKDISGFARQIGEARERQKQLEQRASQIVETELRGIKDPSKLSAEEARLVDIMAERSFAKQGYTLTGERLPAVKPKEVLIEQPKSKGFLETAKTFFI